MFVLTAGLAALVTNVERAQTQANAPQAAE